MAKFREILQYLTVGCGKAGTTIIILLLQNTLVFMEDNLAIEFKSIKKCKYTVVQQFYLYPSEISKDMCKHSGIRMFIITLPIVKTWMQLKCPKIGCYGISIL